MRTARTLLLTAVAASLALATPVRAQPSLLSGRVVDEATSLPIAGAMVQLPQRERLLRTDSTGAFFAGPLEPGPIVVMVRAVGYMPVTTSFRLVPRDSLVAQFQLRSSRPTLTAVRAEADRPTGLPWMYDARLRDFENRRKAGFGRFLDWRVFEKEQGRDISRILRQHIPGLRIVRKRPPGAVSQRSSASEYLATARSGATITSTDDVCYVQIVVNDIVMRGFDLASLRALDVIGVEYYTVTTTPSRFRVTGLGPEGSHCGTAIFWTKQ